MSASVPGPGPADSQNGHRGLDLKRTAAGLTVLLVVAGAATIAIYNDRRSFVSSLHRIGPGALAVSFALGLVGVATTSLVWLSTLRGLGVDLGTRQGSRVFFRSQLGKYIPGSIWPVVMQMEAGRSRGAERRTMLTGNLITLALSCGVGLVIAVAVLPFSDGEALRRYWWVLLTLPALLAILHPRALPGILDRVFALVGRPPLGDHLDLNAELRAAAWSFASWIGYGAHVAALTLAFGRGITQSILLSLGGIALALPVGVLFLPAPAGAGIRDVVLTLVLGVILTPGGALAVVVASRFLLIACDLTLAFLATLVGERVG